MSHKRIISINPSQEELWDRAEAQGYVVIKTENGRTWAFTEEELTGKTNKEEKNENV